LIKAVATPLGLGLLAGLTLSLIAAGDVRLQCELAESIFEEAPSGQCHASTIVDLPNGDLLAAWFAGKREGDNSVEIWLARKPLGGVWSSPRVVPNWGWAAWMERSPDGDKNWLMHGAVVYSEVSNGVIQPTLWESSPGHVKMLLRSAERTGVTCESTSAGGGRTWTPARPPSAPNPNNALDGVKMTDGRIALLYDHSRHRRTRLTLGFSADEGNTWGIPNTLEGGPGEYLCPAVIRTPDGKLHITYTWSRGRIKHAVVNPADVRM
jgi:predicted neuraminidase